MCSEGAVVVDGGAVVVGDVARIVEEGWLQAPSAKRKTLLRLHEGLRAVGYYTDIAGGRELVAHGYGLHLEALSLCLVRSVLLSTLLPHKRRSRPVSAGGHARGSYKQAAYLSTVAPRAKCSASIYSSRCYITSQVHFIFVTTANWPWLV